MQLGALTSATRATAGPQVGRVEDLLTDGAGRVACLVQRQRRGRELIHGGRNGQSQLLEGHRVVPEDGLRQVVLDAPGLAVDHAPAVGVAEALEESLAGELGRPFHRVVDLRTLIDRDLVGLREDDVRMAGPRLVRELDLGQDLGERAPP